MNRIFGSFISGRAAVGLLIVRVVFGLALMLHGWDKMQAPSSWMGEGAPVPGALQALAAFAEFGGGLALIVGFLTPLAALGIAATMAVAIVTAHLKAGHPFVDLKGGPSYELASAYLAVALLALFTGPGALSLDALIFGRKKAV